MDTVRWNLSVSTEIDKSIRLFLAKNGNSKKGHLSRFVEDAVRAYILERTVEQAKMANAHISEEELDSMISEAVNWARKS
ncbi:MAG: hypothetical protein HamCj_06620 [Candidatus Hamiltonella defensa (Ceratovacuna japonica)]